MTGRWQRVLGVLATAVLATACGESIDPDVRTGREPDISVAPTASAEPPTASAEPTYWGRGTGALFAYGSFQEWSHEMVRQGAGIAIVRVTDVSATRWSTEDNQRPTSEEEALANSGQAAFTLGRLVSVEKVRMLSGDWPADSEALYCLPGGSMGSDVTVPGGLSHHLPEPKVGRLAIAGTWPGADLDEGDGTLWLNAFALFPADDSGRVATPDPNEDLTVDQAEEWAP